MRILYSLPHSTDHLAVARAGHLVRAWKLLDAICGLGHEVLCVEAASAFGVAAAARSYRHFVRRLLPLPTALRIRDAGRLIFAKRSGHRLIDAIHAYQPEVLLETHTAFALAGQIAAASTGVPLVIDDVAPVWEEAQQYGVGLPRLAASVFRRVTSQASLLIAVSEPIRRHLIQQGILPGRIVIIENGIDPELFHPAVDGRSRRASLGIDDDCVAIVYVGSFQPFHRVPLLLQAFAQIRCAPRLHLILVGDGRTAGECRQLVEQLGIENRVTFTGAVPYHEVPALIVAADIAVIPASNDYGDSMKLYEYMAVGRPVVAPRQDPIMRLAQHERTAFLFARDEIDSLASAMATLAAQPALRARLGRAGAEHAAHHTWQSRAERLLQSIAAIIPGNVATEVAGSSPRKATP